MSYAEKLRDPRWQKKRLEVMERDGWGCVNCGAASKSLNVHHKHEDYRIEPWDHENETMVTLCDTCHERLHEKLKFVRAKLEDMDMLHGVWKMLSFGGGMIVFDLLIKFHDDSVAMGYMEGRHEAESSNPPKP